MKELTFNIDEYLNKFYSKISESYIPMFSLNEEEVPDGCIPILDHHGPMLRVRTTADGAYINLYLNEATDIDEGYFIYDYYGSGQLYVNAGPNLQLQYANELFAKVISTSFINIESNSPFINYPQDGTAVAGFGTNLIEAVNYHETMAWRFAINDYFQLKIKTSLNLKKKAFPAFSNFPAFSIKETEPAATQNQDVPLCKYFDFVSDADMQSKLVHLSEDYGFANRINNVRACCAPARNINTNSLVFCGFDVENQTHCRMYSPNITNVYSENITLFNSNDHKTFSIYHYQTLFNKNVFSLKNDTDQVLLTKIEFDSDISYDQGLASAMEALTNFSSCYSESSVTANQLSEQEKPEPKSYILSLLG